MATFVESDLKAFFSIATTPRHRGGCYSFHWIVLLTFDLYIVILSVWEGGIKYHFLSLWYDSNLGLNPCLLDHWQTLYSLSQFFFWKVLVLLDWKSISNNVSCDYSSQFTIITVSLVNFLCLMTYQPLCVI